MVNEDYTIRDPSSCELMTQNSTQQTPEGSLLQENSLLFPTPHSLGDYDVGDDVLLLDGRMCRLRDYAMGRDGRHFLISVWHVLHDDAFSTVAQKHALLRNRVIDVIAVKESHVNAGPAQQDLCISFEQICCEITVRCPIGRAILSMQEASSSFVNEADEFPEKDSDLMGNKSTEPHVKTPAVATVGGTYQRFHYVEPFHGCWLCLLSTRPTAFMYMGSTCISHENSSASKDSMAPNSSILCSNDSSTSGQNSALSGVQSECNAKVQDSLENASTDDRLIMASSFIQQHHPSCRHASSSKVLAREQLMNTQIQSTASVSSAVKRLRTNNRCRSTSSASNETQNSSVDSLVLNELTHMRILLQRDAYRREVVWRRDLEEMYHRFFNALSNQSEVSFTHDLTNENNGGSRLRRVEVLDQEDRKYHLSTASPLVCPSRKYGKGNALGMLHHRRYGKCIRGVLVQSGVHT